MREKNNKKRFSILIPVYNKEKFVDKCLQSIINQSYKNFECIIIDDGSTDASLAVIEKIVSGDGRFIVHAQRNRGIANTRQTLLNCANGDYILWVDPDDWIDFNLLEMLNIEIDKNSADCYIFPYTIVGREKYQRKDLFKIGQFDKINVFEELSLEVNMPSFLANKVIRKEAYTGLSFIPDFNIFEDYMILHHVLHRCNTFYYINSATYYYRKYDGSLTSVIDEEGFERLLHCMKSRKNYLILKYPGLKSQIAAGQCYVAFINLIYNRIGNINIENRLIRVIRKNALKLLVNNRYSWKIKIKIIFVFLNFSIYKFLLGKYNKIKNLF